jgi:hypothetical protein
MFFERNLRNIITLARANDRIMFSSFAYYPGSDVMTSYMKTAVDEYNILIRQIAEEMDVPFYDLMASWITITRVVGMDWLSSESGGRT